MIKKYAFLWIPFVIFFTIALLLLCDQTLPIDLWVYRNVSWMIQEPIITIMKLFTFLGEPKTILIGSILWFLYLIRKNKTEVKPFLFTLLISLFFIVILKQLFIRERPNILRLIPIDGYSFPSGHSIISVSFYGYLALYYIRTWRHKTLPILIATILIIGIGFSRIYLGVHYFSDVIAGYALGTLSIGIGNLFRKEEVL